MKKLRQNKISVRKSPTHGFGVFAEKTIRRGEIIEECYFILSKGGDKGLDDFYFDAKGKYAVFLGFGSIYNHAEDPNTDYTLNIKKRIATIKAIRTIKKDEEIFVTYGEDWFSDRGLTPKGSQLKKKPKKRKKQQDKRRRKKTRR